MLGIKTNRDSVKGVFADRLREEIAAAQAESYKDKGQILAKSSEEQKR